MRQRIYYAIGFILTVAIIGGLIALSAQTQDSTADAEPAAVKSTGPPPADPREYARELASPAAELEEAYTSWSSSCREDFNGFACGISALTVTMSADTLTIDLRRITTTTATGYLGPLSGDAADLLEDTIADATAMHEAAKAQSDAMCNMVLKPSPECLQMSSAVDTAWNTLQFDLKGWQQHA